ncbi:phenylalanine--tRNA ligase subunit beta [Rhodococcoides kyotonense]|uniref:Phenylalanine--tRNA ligase beta subunit n=1 Tax=Rhodococcoides kyotonense TaxID=398843 RepID=A0A239KQJ1_9NOCA|nr:phenylalanine--tRNA ligase subunit beta [Rhodococcus kyotonensis]SNT20315.1 phenylalanyl-tRNA synthetase beta chain [Rhodococcus kyotonensis]
MRVPQSWLTEVLQRTAPQWNVTPEELDEGFVRVGFEVEELESLDTVTGPLVVGRVTTITELTEFKKPIRFCLVDVGNDEPQEIVCGARNFAEGDLIVAALPGSVLPGGFAIASRKTYGQNSNGMICSTAELGLGRDSSGILVLPEGTAAPGDDAKAVLGLDDSVIELNVTPDRGYAFSVRGLARELASSFDLEFADPAVHPVQNNEGDTWPTTVDEESGASRFALRKVSGIDPKAITPWWLQRRLLLAGIRPISAAVDVTNYVLHELGQPLHAFDAAKLTGDIVVRRAKAGEKLTTLDDVERTLDAEDVVIADGSGAISLAGVMGGASTEVGDDTVDVILEAATFDPLAVFRTGRRHKLSSEASKRFERTVDSALPVAALDRAAQLLVDIAGGRIEPVLTDIGSANSFPAVRIDIDLPDRVAGVTYPNGVAARRLTQIGCDVEVGVSDSGHGELVVTPPTWRPDLQQPADLVEEVLRLEGLEKIPSVLPTAPAGRGLTATQKRKRAVGKSLAFAGYVEVLPTVFLPTGVFDTWGLPEDDTRRRTTSVLNPLEADRPDLATTVLPGLFEILARNVARGQRDLSLFGIAQVVLPHDGTVAVDALAVHERPSDEDIARLRGSLPNQPVHVGVVLSGHREPSGPWGPGRAAEASDAFAAARTIAAAAGVEIEFRAAQYLPWHPGRCAELLVDGVVVGHAGELHPAVLERAELPARTCAVELNLDALPIVESLPAPIVSPFPAVLQDVAVVVDKSVPAAEVEAALKGGAGDLLESLRLFDVFEGEQVGENRKSLAFALVFRGSDGTLTEAQATEARDAAVAAASQAVGAELRR